MRVTKPANKVTFPANEITKPANEVTKTANEVTKSAKKSRQETLPHEVTFPANGAEGYDPKRGGGGGWDLIFLAWGTKQKFEKGTLYSLGHV